MLGSRSSRTGDGCRSTDPHNPTLEKMSGAWSWRKTVISPCWAWPSKEIVRSLISIRSGKLLESDGPGISSPNSHDEFIGGTAPRAGGYAAAVLRHDRSVVTGSPAQG